jgi:hypothetical protein
MLGKPKKEINMKIPLRSRTYHGYYAEIDEEDYPLIKNYKWRASKTPTKCRDHFYANADAYKIIDSNEYYPTGNGKRNPDDLKTSITMHRLIMDFPKRPHVVDHINGNGLDNIRSNLRIVTHRENRINSINVVEDAQFQRSNGGKVSHTFYLSEKEHDSLFELSEFLGESGATVVYNALVFYIEKNYPDYLVNFKGLTK